MNVSKEAMIWAVRAFCRLENEREKERWLDLFSDDAVHEPGARRFVGREAIGANFDTFPQGLHLWCEDPVLVHSGNEATAMVRCRLGSDEQEFRVIDHFVFNEEAKITHLRNFVDS